MFNDFYINSKTFKSMVNQICHIKHQNFWYILINIKVLLVFVGCFSLGGFKEISIILYHTIF